ncbi:zinc finger 182-like isoform X3 [Pelobates cultripes]|uniref:Zinc finger 182-like isoform X3 n=1 Tax=Pelobates cultripes TaxID=61616 RepID=A0AAD1RUX6_PELCU|nr:zinc finger 182-like isoform X3 [Pelobates cultripes]
MTKCIVKGCANTTSKNSGFKLHGFPNSLTAIKCWLKQIGNEIGDIDALAQHILDSRKRWIFCICSAPFSPLCYIWDGKKLILRGDAVPTIFPGTKSRAVVAATGDINASHLPAKKIKVDSLPKLLSPAQGLTSIDTERGQCRKCCHPVHITKDAYTSTHKKMVNTSSDPPCNRRDRGVQWPEFEFNFDGELWKVQLDHFYPSTSSIQAKAIKKCKTSAQSHEHPYASGTITSPNHIYNPQPY